MSVLDPPLEERLRASRLFRDPLAFVPLASVLALPAAYVFASGYELGRADRFGIPPSMVRVELRTALVPFMTLLFLIWCAVPFLYQIQQLGGLVTLRVIAKRLRGLFFLLEAIAAFTLVVQRQFTPLGGLGALGVLYVLLYGIPWVLSRLYAMLRRSTRRRFLGRNVRRVLSAIRRHIFGEAWAPKSLRFQLAYSALGLVLVLILLPYGIGSVVVVINQKYYVLGLVSSQGNAEAIIAIYGGKVFIAEVRRGVAQGITMKNADDVKDLEIREAEFAGLAFDLCRSQPDRFSQLGCLVVG